MLMLQPSVADPTSLELKLMQVLKVSQNHKTVKLKLNQKTLQRQEPMLLLPILVEQTSLLHKQKLNLLHPLIQWNQLPPLL
jgi:hypothetical protein